MNFHAKFPRTIFLSHVAVLIKELTRRVWIGRIRVNTKGSKRVATEIAEKSKNGEKGPQGEKALGNWLSKV